MSESQKLYLPQLKNLDIGLSRLLQAGYRLDKKTSVEWNNPDARTFINDYVYIDEPHGQDIAIIPFKLWPKQSEILSHLTNTSLVIILKARQLGISWLCCAYALWLCMAQPGRVVLLFSKGQIEANELARRISVMYQRLPAGIQAYARLVKDNTAELEWSNGSRVQSLAATKNAGRSFTASLAIMDEFAFMQYASEIYTALKPTIDGGGQLFVVSTANGEGNLFHKFWNGATKHENNFLPLFLNWRARPDRTDEWRRRVAAEAISSQLDLQEYPNTPEDAFQSTEADRFLPSMVWWDVLKEALPPVTRNEPMVLAMDAATGRAISASDCFGLVGVTRHPNKARHNDVAVRFIMKWQARAGGSIDFQGTEQSPGPERVIRRLCKDLNIAEVCYDPTQLHDMATRIRRDGIVRMYEFSQSSLRSESDKLLYDLITQKRLAHDGNADLRAHIDNADRKVDAQDKKLRIVKREESLKVDLAVCLSMANYECLRLNL